ncbi:flagellar hook-basal body protein [Alkaliphilus serpentinus]|uniref:Flagellar hook-basal body protein n=1 Tax=Alkaliphilus serpentinus TaxID=1482731 RepID=A0A833MCU9_9FIRM|nr:flagellar hook-basal body protein [Alkaliphilus serpentinus]KAB3526664.1 flagellar hook-basal body protein [Alkaliphilus serpentinus]
MLRGLYTAVSAMQTTEKRLDVTANNMANVNTTSFKKDVVITESFPEVLLQKINGSHLPEAFNNSTQTEVHRVEGGFQLKTEGGLFSTQNSIGVSYNREIQFAVDAEGYLRTFSRDADGQLDTSSGSLVLDTGGNSIFVGEEAFEINQQGQVIVNGQPLANLITRGHYNTIGTINGGLRLNSIATDFSQGSMEQTGNSLDLALKGDGFFKVLTPEGEELYTRNGSFTLNANGEIITAEGLFLAGQWGSILAQDGSFQVTESGEILINGEVVDQIDILEIDNIKDLRKRGEGYFYPEEGVEIQATAFTGEVLQGFLEASNVNPIREMVDMISIYRTYESNQKVVRSYDELLQKAVNDIGRLG